MSSKSIDELRDIVGRIQRRRARLLNLREICLVWVGLAAVFAALAVVEMKFQLPPFGRVGLTGVLAAAAGLLAWRFFHIQRHMQSDGRRIAQFVDEQNPQLQQHLMTSLEFEGKKPTGDAAAPGPRLPPP